MESTDLNWRKASHSSNGGAECVEIGGTQRAVLVRDTQDRGGPMLQFSSDTWRRFTSQMKTRA
jgi:hypothetical protein